MELQLSGPNRAEFCETLLKAEHWKELGPGTIQPWGNCTFQQEIKIEWEGFLKNEGLGTATEVAVDLTVSNSEYWSISAVEKLWKQRDGSGRMVIQPSPIPMACFETAKSDRAFGRIVEPIHPGQETKVAFGTLRIPFSAWADNPSAFEVSGYAYATDSQPFQLRFCASGAEIAARYGDAYRALRDKALPTDRAVPEPPIPPIRKFVLNDDKG